MAAFIPSVIQRSARPTPSSSAVKPSVAPLTNGRVRQMPWLAPDEAMAMFTGPGEMDIDSEKIVMVVSKASNLDS